MFIFTGTKPQAFISLINTPPTHNFIREMMGATKTLAETKQQRSLSLEQKARRRFHYGAFKKTRKISGFKWVQCSKGKRSDLNAAFVELYAGAKIGTETCEYGKSCRAARLKAYFY